MRFGYRLFLWRRAKGLTQQTLAQKTSLARPYLSRLERNEVDPSLSLVYRLSFALDLSVGDFLTQTPTCESLDRFELDALAKAALRPVLAPPRHQSRARSLSRALKEKRAAHGFYKSRQAKKKEQSSIRGIETLRRIRADLGEDQWQALLKRIDKHAYH